jgi:hypothetical protein
MKCYWGDKIKDEISRTCSTHGRVKNLFKMLVGKPEDKTLLGRPRCRWQDNIRLDFNETDSEDIDWIPLVQDRVQWWTLVNMVINIQIL